MGRRAMTALHGARRLTVAALAVLSLLAVPVATVVGGPGAGTSTEEAKHLLEPLEDSLRTTVEAGPGDLVELGGDPADGYFMLRIELASKSTLSLPEVTAAFRAALVQPVSKPVISFQEVPATEANRIRYQLQTDDATYGIASLELASDGADSGSADRATLRACVWNDRAPSVSAKVCSDWMDGS